MTRYRPNGIRGMKKPQIAFVWTIEWHSGQRSLTKDSRVPNVLNVKVPPGDSSVVAFAQSAQNPLRGLAVKHGSEQNLSAPALYPPIVIRLHAEQRAIFSSS